MSTHHNLHCIACSAEPAPGDGVPWINHARDEFARILKARSAILASARMLPDFAEISFEIHGQSVRPVPFLEAHEGHAMAVRNEYGDVEPIEDEP